MKMFYVLSKLANYGQLFFNSGGIFNYNIIKFRIDLNVFFALKIDAKITPTLDVFLLMLLLKIFIVLCHTVSCMALTIRFFLMAVY